MRCDHCGMEWSISSRGASVQKYCPFCGKSIIKTVAHPLTSLEETLFIIVRDYGIQRLEDGEQAMAYFSDLAPQLRKERMMLRHLIQCDGNVLLISALPKPPEEQRACLAQARDRMVEDLFLSESAAEMICASFWNAITAAEKPPVREASPAELYEAACKSEDPQEALELLTKAAEGGYARAQYKLAGWYREGRKVQKDPQKAFRWYKLAAESGETDALCNLGWCYGTGFGCSVDPGTAVACFRKAAAAGIVEAQYNLAVCCAEGKGVERDEAKAASLYEQAAKGGFAEAQYCLGYCYDYGKGLPKDLDLALFWYRKAAQNGSARAQFVMGTCYEQGKGFEKDENIAYFWYRRAAENGYSQAKEKLKNWT